MKRDMELIRDILLAIQARPDVNISPVTIEGQDELTVSRHVEMLFRAGFVEGKEHNSQSPSIIFVSDLSWEGHDFLAVLGNQTVWAKIKGAFSPDQLAQLPLAVIKNVGMGLLTKWAEGQAGL